MSDEQRGSVQPEDWPDEEGGGEAQKSLRRDEGVSMQRPKSEHVPDEKAVGAGATPGHGKLGTPTPGDKGTEQGPR